MWIDLDGLANMRDVGGIPTTDGGKIVPGRLLRSDNLQTLTSFDVDQLLGLGLTDVIDLRSDYEAEREGPGPLIGSDVRIDQYSLFREWESGVGETKPDVRPEVLPEEALPWIDLEPSVELDDAVASVYFSYLVDRPDSVLAALRTVARAPGTALIDCAAGKDRTGTLVALAHPRPTPNVKRSSTTTRRVRSVSSRSWNVRCPQQPTLREPRGQAHFLTP